MRIFASLILAFAIALVPAALRPAAAAEPPNFTYAPAPPGSIVESRVVYLAGEGMQSQWRAVVSKKLLAHANGTGVYQWYVSIYQIADTVYHLRYRSPGNGGPLDTVTKANGAPMWFPMQTVKIAGIGELGSAGVQQLVVQSHESAADCGAATVTVFSASGTGHVISAATVENGCGLTAAIVPSNGTNVIRLTGPYYGPNAAMCCPTKPNATAILRFANGAWKETPSYYALKGTRPLP